MALLFTLHTQTHRSYIYSFQSFCIILFRYFLYRIHFFVRNSMVWKTRCWCTDVYAFTEMNSSETHKTLIMHANKIVCGCMCKRFSWREQTTQFWISILRTKKNGYRCFMCCWKSNFMKMSFGFSSTLVATEKLKISQIVQVTIFMKTFSRFQF